MSNSPISTSDITFMDKMRMIFWPIEQVELKKFLPMAFMLFCILFNFTCLRGLKDSLVVPSIGAEALSFLKFYIVTPSAILFTILYIKLLNAYSEEKVFYVIVSIFISFFVLFGYYLYPNQDLIHPNSMHVKELAHSWPRFKWFIYLWGKWSYVTMYVFAELWSSVMVNLLFWQLANKICKTSEAKRFYLMFGLIGNLGLIAAGNVMMKFATVAKAGDKLANDTMFSNIISVVIALAVILALLYRYMNKVVMPDPRFYTPSSQEKKKKPKLSFSESIKTIMTSRYLGLILLLILGYGISINLIEGVWKAKVRELYPTQHEYMYFMGLLGTWMGVGAMCSYIIGNNILRIFGWFTAAAITPMMLLITGIGFFVFCLTQHKLTALQDLIGFSPLAIAVALGFIQNVLAKATKYSLFDGTKEMAYIPIDNELKTKGKAAVDVIGARFGKSSGAVIQSSLFLIFPTATFNDLMPLFMVLCTGILLVWLYSVKLLNKEYSVLQEEYDRQQDEAKAAL